MNIGIGNTGRSARRSGMCFKGSEVRVRMEVEGLGTLTKNPMLEPCCTSYVSEPCFLFLVSCSFLFFLSLPFSLSLSYLISPSFYFVLPLTLLSCTPDLSILLRFDFAVLDCSFP